MAFIQPRDVSTPAGALQASDVFLRSGRDESGLMTAEARRQHDTERKARGEPNNTAATIRESRLDLRVWGMRERRRTQPMT